MEVANPKVANNPTLNMIITVSAGSPLAFKKRSEVANQYSVTIPAVLKAVGEEIVRETGTEIAPGDALEVQGSQEAVLKLYSVAKMTK